MIRNPYLDFLRAMAILLVLVHHVGQEWPVARPWLAPYTSLGAKGVDLFFVLSGWLIGGLYWREQKKFGNVALLRFWQRRWLRTIPPYAAGLALALIAVWTTRREPFDAGYLIFIQNYYPVIPFFLVSWSLCVEEHFYLFIPLVFLFPLARRPWVLFVLCCMPTIFRFQEASSMPHAFGYSLTATHLHADGLLMGFTASYMITIRQSRISTHSFSLFSIMAATAALLFVGFESTVEYITTPFLVAILFISLLLLLVDSPHAERFRSSTITWIAGISYSIYLTHALVIHACNRHVFTRLPGIEPLMLTIEIGAILLTGEIFSRLFEKTALRLRKRLTPARI